MVIALAASQPLPVLVALTVIASAATAIASHLAVAVRGRGRSRRPRAGPGEPVVGAARPVADPAPPATRRAEVDRAAAEEFLELFHAENPQAGPVAPRIAAVMREIDMTGTYWHTAEELAFGARVAWRNNARCIGRLYWRSLQVRDLQDGLRRRRRRRALLRAPAGRRQRREDPADDQRVRPGDAARPAPRIWNEQLIRYAGYEQPDGLSSATPATELHRAS